MQKGLEIIEQAHRMGGAKLNLSSPSSPASSELLLLGATSLQCMLLHGGRLIMHVVCRDAQCAGRLY